MNNKNGETKARVSFQTKIADYIDWEVLPDGLYLVMYIYIYPVIRYYYTVVEHGNRLHYLTRFALFISSALYEYIEFVIIGVFILSCISKKVTNYYYKNYIRHSLFVVVCCLLFFSCFPYAF